MEDDIHSTADAIGDAISSQVEDTGAELGSLYLCLGGMYLGGEWSVLSGNKYFAWSFPKLGLFALIALISFALMCATIEVFSRLLERAFVPLFRSLLSVQFRTRWESWGLGVVFILFCAFLFCFATAFYHVQQSVFHYIWPTYVWQKPNIFLK